MRFNASFTTKCSILPGCCRQAARVGTKMLSMAVQTEKLCICANEAGFDDGEAVTDSQVHFTHHITYASRLPSMHACPGWWCLIYAGMFACVFPDPHGSLCGHAWTVAVHQPVHVHSACSSLCITFASLVSRKLKSVLLAIAGQIDGTDVRWPLSRPTACFLQTPAGRCICRCLHCVH